MDPTANNKDTISNWTRHIQKNCQTKRPEDKQTEINEPISFSASSTLDKGMLTQIQRIAAVRPLHLQTLARIFSNSLSLLQSNERGEFKNRLVTRNKSKTKSF